MKIKLLNKKLSSLMEENINIVEKIIHNAEDIIAIRLNHVFYFVDYVAIEDEDYDEDDMLLRVFQKNNGLKETYFTVSEIQKAKEVILYSLVEL